MNEGMNFLVQETLNYRPQDLEREQGPELEQFPDKTGVLYFIKKSLSTFGLKILPTHNLREAYQQIGESHDNNNEFYEHRDELRAFPTDYYEVAEIIADQVANRRFPTFEEDLFNVSDPGNSWWLKDDSNNLKIFFKSHALGPKQGLTKLGPLGDLSVAQRRFPRMVETLKSFIMVTSEIIDEKSFDITVDTRSLLLFNEFKQVFLNGTISRDLRKEIESSFDHSLYYYLQELAHIRRFWMQIDRSQIKQ